MPHLNSRDAPAFQCWKTPPRSRLSSRWWNLGEHRSVWLERLPLLPCRRCRPCPVERHFLLLAPFGCPEPFVHVEGAKLRRASCEKDKTSVRAATVNSSKESSHHLWWAPERVNPLVDASASHFVLWEVNCVFFCGSNVRTSSFASSVECVAKNARWPSRKEIRVCLFLNTSLGEVHEVMTLASDAPGSLFGQLEKITRDSGHHS